MFGSNIYKKLIKKLKKKGLEFSTDWQSEIYPNYLLLRHDVDFSVNHAYEIAKIDKSQNIFSTFFFMLTSNMYNLLSNTNRHLVQEIKEMGHKISLHFDPTVYKKIDEFKKEREIFEKNFMVEVDIVSIHRPGVFLNNNNIDLFGSKQTYQNKYFKKMKYISDSSGRDVSHDLDNYLESKKKTGLHLLLHPIWWVDESSNQTVTLDEWKKKYLSFLTTEIRENCKTYKG